jgi:ATP-dependent protease HslVU (ClpYQ) peptidase subunit
MQAAYDQAKTAEEIARAGLEAAAEFDSATSAPFEIHNVPLLTAEKPKAKRKK